MLMVTGKGHSVGGSVAGAPARAITGSMLADLVTCERRVHHDIHTDPAFRDAVSGFVEMLWANGNRHEAEIVAGLGHGLVDLREVPAPDRVAATLAAMEARAPLIAGARFELGDRVGMPDLLMLIDGVYRSGEIKGGTPFAANAVDCKAAYAMQIGFYASLITDGGWGAGDRAFVIGDDGVLVWFDMEAPSRSGGASIGRRAAGMEDEARGIRDGTVAATAAACAACGMCVWKSVCRAELASADDPTLVAGLGRATRLALTPHAATVTALAALSHFELPQVKGVGPARLATFVERARLLRTPGASAYATRPLGLARRHHEIHLDLETDPTNGEGLVYLHGARERVGVGPCTEERYVHFLADSHHQERDAFAAALAFLNSDPDAWITTYSAFERTTYGQLQRRYPEVATLADVEALFTPPRGVDLYFDAVLPATVWPLGSMGLKSIARHLGFEWSDPDAGGAASISWFVEWTETRDPTLLERILTYNSEDCEASMVVLDGLIALPVRGPLVWPPATDAGGEAALIVDHGDRSLPVEGGNDD